MGMRLADILSHLPAETQAQLWGDADLLVHALSTLEAAGPHELTFLSHPKYLSKFSASSAGCILISEAMRSAAEQRGGSYVVAPDPYYCFALITQIWKRHHSQTALPSVHPSASIDPSADVSALAFVGAFACIGAGATVAAGAHIAEHCVVGDYATVGADTHLSARVTLSAGCRIGERCLVHPGAVIGADGFGFALHEGRWVKIEQLGAVQIGHDVEIGANTCIDRGALLDTVIEDGVKLDNLVQIGHNVRVGKHTAMAGCAGVAGSATIGAHCTVGGGAIVLGHLQLADGVHVSAASVVTRSLLRPGNYTGLFPIDDNASWEKNAATLKQLHALRDRLKQLEKLLSTTEKS